MTHTDLVTKHMYVGTHLPLTYSMYLSQDTFAMVMGQLQNAWSCGVHVCVCVCIFILCIYHRCINVNIYIVVSEHRMQIQRLSQSRVTAAN